MSDSVIVADAANGGFTVTLPSVAGLTGKQYTIKKADASNAAVKVAAYGSQQIDASSTQSLTASYASLTVVCDGSAWQAI